MATLTNAQILSSIASTTTDQGLKNFITNHPNLEVFGNLITTDSFQLEKNALISTIVNGIAKRIVNAKILDNKLKELKGDKIPYGSQIEEIIANPSKGTPYDMSSTDLLTQQYPDVKSVYYRINRQDKYKVTVNDVQLQRALIQPNGLSELIQMVVGTLYSGDNLDEMRYTKELVSSAILNNRVKKIIVGDSLTGISDPSATMTIDKIEFGAGATQNDRMKKFVSKLRQLSYDFGFGSSKFNGYTAIKKVGEDDLITACDANDQVLLLRTDILSSVDVELLSMAFNMTKADFLQRVIPVDDFNGMNVWGILCDAKWFRINDTYYGVREFQNGSNLSTNYYLHHHSIISYNLLANAVVFLDSKDETLNNA
ncbi:MAG: hypothetical protein Q8936_24830 [Bacillota bacterium]|nr:hypothetical protein [Bacillota bacterium]